MGAYVYVKKIVNHSAPSWRHRAMMEEKIAKKENHRRITYVRNNMGLCEVWKCQRKWNYVYL